MFNTSKSHSIPVTVSFALTMTFFFALKIINPAGFQLLFVLKNGLAEFFPWQIVTYIFNDNISVFYYFFKVLIVFWLCSVLESEWGSLHFSIFLFSGIILKSITALAINVVLPGIPFEGLLNGYGSLLSPNSLMLTLMTAFGFIYPDERIYLFFFIPVRIKLLSLISLGIALLQLVMFYTSGMSFIASSAVALIYIAGYAGLLLYFKRIFLFHQSSFSVNSIFNVRLNRLKKAVQRPVENNAKEISTKPVRDPATLPLCDEEDFDAQSDYCKSCDRFNRCTVRAGFDTTEVTK